MCFSINKLKKTSQVLKQGLSQDPFLPTLTLVERHALSALLQNAECLLLIHFRHKDKLVTYSLYCYHCLLHRIGLTVDNYLNKDLTSEWNGDLGRWYFNRLLHQDPNHYLPIWCSQATEGDNHWKLVAVGQHSTVYWCSSLQDMCQASSSSIQWVLANKKSLSHEHALMIMEKIPLGFFHSSWWVRCNVYLMRLTSGKSDVSPTATLLMRNAKKPGQNTEMEQK